MTPFELFNLGVFTGILIVIFILLFKRLVGCDEDDKFIKESSIRHNNIVSNDNKSNRRGRDMGGFHNTNMERVIKKKK